MASKFDKALPGFNTNLKHGGKIYHIQTEDSGKSHPHIITHVFVDGNIIASKKDSYGDHLGSPNVNDIVRDMMKKQHKEMVSKLKKNDEVVTSGGVNGTIVNVKDDTVTVRVDENVKIEFQRSAVIHVKNRQEDYGVGR